MELTAAAGVSDRGHPKVSSEVFRKLIPLSSEYFLFKNSSASENFLFRMLLGRWKVIVDIRFSPVAFFSDRGPKTSTSEIRFPPFLSTSGETYLLNFLSSEAFIDYIF